MKTSSQVRTNEILKVWAQKAIGPSRYEFVLKMTLLYLILYSSKLLLPNDARWFPIAAKFLAVSMLLFPALLKNRYLWLGLSGMGISALILGWDYVDNHFYLTNYWLAACTISTFLGASLPVLAFNGRFLAQTRPFSGSRAPVSLRNEKPVTTLPASAIASAKIRS